MPIPIRIGTRESRLAVWQATLVQEHLSAEGFSSDLVYIKSDGDLDLSTPLYEMGVQGIFTRSLDIALLEKRIDIAVHSMKDVPTQLPQGITQAAVLARGAVNDLLVLKGEAQFLDDSRSVAHIATSSSRRKAQWLNRYPQHQIYNLRGNMQTRLNKLDAEPWNAAIFAQAGLERINLRPENSLVLDWMLPAPAQGAILVVCRQEDRRSLDACSCFNDTDTALCTGIERSFLRGLMGGCSTPVSALAQRNRDEVYFRGSILSPDGSKKIAIEKRVALSQTETLGQTAAEELLENGGREIAAIIRAQSKVLFNEN